MTQKLTTFRSAGCLTDHHRATALSRLAILDTLPEREFDNLVQLAQRSLKCRIASIALIDRDRQWFKAKIGLSVSQIPIDQSFCAHAVHGDEILVVPDASRDPRFATNPMVVGAPFIRFYAGVPIRVSIAGMADRVAIGTLCVIDDTPRALSADDIETLHALAQLAEALMEARGGTAHVAALAEERQENLLRLDRKQRQFRQAERMANIGSWRLSLLDNSTEWSDQVFVIHGLPVGPQPTLDAALDFYPAHARPMVAAAVDRTIRTGQPFDFETDFVTANGVLKRVRSMGEIEISNGRPVAVIGVFQDITAQYLMEQELRRKAIVDDLTQLGNRAACNRAIEERIAAARHRNDPLALLLIDLDGFKQVNDRFGHLAGDELLRLTSSRLKAPYLADCFVGRLGGDEFIVLASTRDDCASLDQIVRSLLLDLRQSVAGTGGALQVSGTVGIAWLDDSVGGRSDLLQRADQALYDAKRDEPGSARTFRGGKIIATETSSRPGQLRVVA